MDDNKDLLNEIDKLEDDKEASAVKEEGGTSHEKIFTIIIILIIIASLTVLYFFYKGRYIVSNKENKQDDFSSYLDGFENNTDENSDMQEYNENEQIDYRELERQEMAEFEEQKNNLVIVSENFDSEGKLISVINNNNLETIDNVLVQVIFYNGENKPIRIDECIIEALDPNVNYYMNFDNTPEGYERSEYLITKIDFYGRYISQRYNIEYSVEEKDDYTIEIAGKNNANVKLEKINFAILFYNENDQIVAVREETEYDVKKQKNFKIKTDKEIYSYETYEPIEFSRYEVVLLQVFSYIEN